MISSIYWFLLIHYILTLFENESIHEYLNNENNKTLYNCETNSCNNEYFYKYNNVKLIDTVIFKEELYKSLKEMDSGNV